MPTGANQAEMVKKVLLDSFMILKENRKQQSKEMFDSTKIIEDIFASMPTPKEFVRMIHDSRCPLSEVGIYPWEDQLGI